MHLKLLAMESVGVLTACLIHLFCLVSLTSEQKAFSRFNNSREKNDESGSLSHVNLQRNIEELSRIEIIRRRILESTGRHLPVLIKATDADSKSTTNSRVKIERSKHHIESNSTATKSALFKIIPHVQEIISFSELSDNDSNAVLRFSINGKAESDTEAVGAHLWLLVSRRPRARRGNKGMTIKLQVEKVENSQVTCKNDTEILTCLRTKVKKTAWHKMILPLFIAQSALSHDSKTLCLKVTCLGCGRLVKLVLPEHNSIGRTIRGQKHQRKPKEIRHIETNASKPFLVISTLSKFTHAFGT